ncbi:hypothetical protein KEM52_002127 [Ascosphaera acerosa]|nr:hypothetical protein KEM52_002127 [Ascosphaera acerosa]
MEELQARHRKELRDLQARITQKKKSATKKTRRGINDECERWAREIKERHEEEVRQLRGETETETETETDGATTTQDEGEGVTEGEGEEGKTSAEADAATTTGTIDDTVQDLAPKMQRLDVAGSSTTSPANGTSNDRSPVKRKPNRQKARLARRAADRAAEAEQAAAEASQMPDHRAAERQAMAAARARLALRETDIRPDGHCLYSAVAHGLAGAGVPLSLSSTVAAPTQSPSPSLQLQDGYKLVRAATADYLASRADEFAPFVEEPMAEYVRKVRETAEWGGQVELMAIARAFGVRVNVLRGDGSVEKLEPPAPAAAGSETQTPAQESTRGGGREIWLAYYQHSFGLGEHYNALQKMT